MEQMSDHRFCANYFRLYLHAAAMNLLVRLRRFIAEPLPVPVPPADTAAPATSQAGEGTSAAAGERVPAEALTGAERQRYFRLRRQRDPLGEGHPRANRIKLRPNCSRAVDFVKGAAYDSRRSDLFTEETHGYLGPVHPQALRRPPRSPPQPPQAAPAPGPPGHRHLCRHRR